MTNEDNSAKVPKGRTAFLIIHGIGEQNLLETLDYFARNLIEYFEEQQLPLEVEHLLAKRRRANGSLWTESFLRLNSMDTQQDWLIDIHEYYWAYETEAKISVPEVLQWAEKTLEGTIKFYKENPEYLKNIQNDKDGKIFKFRLRSLTLFLRVFNFVYPVLRLALWGILSLLSPFLRGSWLQSTWKLSKTIAIPAIVGFVGDIAIYTTTDAKSPFSQIREQILAESQALLEAIVKDKQANYDQVIVAGHSLGSVIAYDMLNLLCIKGSLSKDCGKSLLIDKIKGLITFGSPLDKIAFFLREQAQKGQYIRQRLLEHLNSFRVKVPESRRYFKTTPVQCQLKNVNWVNFYHKQDPISGHLDYYEKVKNICLKPEDENLQSEQNYKERWGAKAHGSYWIKRKFYEEIAQRFLYQLSQQEPIESNSNGGHKGLVPEETVIATFNLQSL